MSFCDVLKVLQALRELNEHKSHKTKLDLFVKVYVTIENSLNERNGNNSVNIGYSRNR